MSALWVVIDRVRGSSPRDAGTAMKVTAEGTEGTIGGGALEHRAIALARDILASDGAELVQDFALGPALGQCCGGAVRLRFTRVPHSVDSQPFMIHRREANRPHPRMLWLWGAGHVGRAVVWALHPQAFKITWIDDAPSRFPPATRSGIKTIPAANMPLLAARAPRYAHHLIFTHTHEIDFGICAALLDRGAASIGLIGSATKRARFFKRLRAMGLDPALITCPIGDKSLGKSPAAIAQGVAKSLMREGEPA